LSRLDEEREGILFPSSSSLYFTDLRVDFRSDVDFCCCVAYINNHKYFVVCFFGRAYISRGVFWLTIMREGGVGRRGVQLVNS
jgi:hypothetical protein